jgi:hypothetical protein
LDPEVVAVLARSPPLGLELISELHLGGMRPVGHLGLALSQAQLPAVATLARHSKNLRVPSSEWRPPIEPFENRSPEVLILQRLKDVRTTAHQCLRPKSTQRPEAAR